MLLLRGHVSLTVDHRGIEKVGGALHISWEKEPANAEITLTAKLQFNCNLLLHGCCFIIEDLKEHGWPAEAGSCSWSYPHNPWPPPYICRDWYYTGCSFSPATGNHWVRDLIPCLTLNPSLQCQPWVSPHWPGSFSLFLWGCCHPGSLLPPPALGSPWVCSADSLVSLHWMMSALTADQRRDIQSCRDTHCMWDSSTGMMVLLIHHCESNQLATVHNQ